MSARSINELYEPKKIPEPKIYVYTTSHNKEIPWENKKGMGRVKIGYTERDKVETRIKEQTQTASSEKNDYEILLDVSAIHDGEIITDHRIHKILEGKGYKRTNNEWFETTSEVVHDIIKEIKNNNDPNIKREESFDLRPEQLRAVESTYNYFNQGNSYPKKFLWNAKMRFGKTFSAYKLCEKMKWKKILILTYKPAVQDSWKNDLMSHKDFQDWKFIENGQAPSFCLNALEKPLIWFSSFQSIFSQTDKSFEESRLKKMMETKWDVVIMDEYHFGAWNDKTQDIYKKEDIVNELNEDLDQNELNAIKAEKEFINSKIEVDHYLHLSGTPFRSLKDGEFTEDEIFSWSYIDEQKAKKLWEDTTKNPYLEMPEMVMICYNMIKDTFSSSENIQEFSLAEFFKVKKKEKILQSDQKIDTLLDDEYVFVNEKMVNDWLNTISGQTDKSPKALLFADNQLRSFLKHTLWYMGGVQECKVMASMLKKHPFFKSYNIVTAAGQDAGIGIEAIRPVRDAIKGGHNTKTITLSCGKLTTGVSVKQWSGVLMLRSSYRPESYFQTIFRVQTPWTVKNGNSLVVLKDKCYVFNFDSEQAINLAFQYCQKLHSKKEKQIEISQIIDEMLEYMPIILHQEDEISSLFASDVLEIAQAGIGSSMLARKFGSYHMFSVEIMNIDDLMKNEELGKALEKIVGYRNLKDGVENVKKLKGSKPKNQEIVKKETKENNPEVKKFEKMLKEKLLHFIKRLPVFMYINDEREKTVREVIETVDDDLFEKATGITKNDFEILEKHGLFNTNFLNAAIASFKRVEDKALEYLGDRIINTDSTSAWDKRVTK